MVPPRFRGTRTSIGDAQLVASPELAMFTQEGNDTFSKMLIYCVGISALLFVPGGRRGGMKLVAETTMPKPDPTGPALEEKATLNVNNPLAASHADSRNHQHAKAD